MTGGAMAVRLDLLEVVCPTGPTTAPQAARVHCRPRRSTRFRRDAMTSHFDPPESSTVQSENVRNAEAVGSNPITSTPLACAKVQVTGIAPEAYDLRSPLHRVAHRASIARDEKMACDRRRTAASFATESGRRLMRRTAKSLASTVAGSGQRHLPFCDASSCVRYRAQCGPVLEDDPESLVEREPTRRVGR